METQIATQTNVMFRKGWAPTEIARDYGLHVNSVRAKIKSGELKASKFGRRIVVLDSDLQKYFEKCRK